MLNKGYQVLFLDYRGVGLSSPVTSDTIPTDPDNRFQYLKLFRQDNNVRDLEAVRQCLTAGIDDPEKRKWSIFGQSFGGFVSLTYLSKYPEGLREVFMTGGLAPISRTPDEVYKATFEKVRQRNDAYYKKFPEDRLAVRRIASFLFLHKTHAVKLPSGGRLSPKRLLTLGHMFGMHNGLDIVHSMILRMKQDLDQYGFLTRPTLEQAETFLNFDSTPIYAILHEAIYCFKDGVASAWAAQQVGQNHPDFEWLAADYDKGFKQIIAVDEREDPLFFTGEMIFPFMFDDYPELHRMRHVAECLAKYKHWDELYDEDQLANNTVPVYAATYIEDMYVEYNLARETASKIQGIKTFETNASKKCPEYYGSTRQTAMPVLTKKRVYHNAIRARSEEVLQQLFKLRDDVID